MREISYKSLREKRLTYVKKMEKRPKNRFTHTFIFHVEKKNTVCRRILKKKSLFLGEKLNFWCENTLDYWEKCYFGQILQNLSIFEDLV